MSTDTCAPAGTVPIAPRRFASEPPEARGLARDEVRLLLAQPERIRHLRFRDIRTVLRPGDLVVVNTSATLPAAVEGTRSGTPVVVHFSNPVGDGSWVIELRTADASAPLLAASQDEVVDMAGGTRATLLAPYQDGGQKEGVRLWRAGLDLQGPVEGYLAQHGHPISYGHLQARWPLSSYQTVFARHPGSAEMPSAARPFTSRLIVDLIAKGVSFAPILLHAGVSSLEAGESPLPERFHVPAATARLVNSTRGAGRRVIAAGTTTVRALETVARPDGCVEPGWGWTRLVLGPERPARAVAGIITGWHEPGSSHLELLDAVAGYRLVRTAQAAALRNGYLWHEFGDACLFLPD